jgi:hypothetical protein
MSYDDLINHCEKAIMDHYENKARLGQKFLSIDPIPGEMMRHQTEITRLRDIISDARARTSGIDVLYERAGMKHALRVTYKRGVMPSTEDHEFILDISRPSNVTGLSTKPILNASGLVPAPVLLPKLVPVPASGLPPPKLAPAPPKLAPAPAPPKLAPALAPAPASGLAPPKIAPPKIAPPKIAPPKIAPLVNATISNDVIPQLVAVPVVKSNQPVPSSAHSTEYRSKIITINNMILDGKMDGVPDEMLDIAMSVEYLIKVMGLGRDPPPNNKGRLLIWCAKNSKLAPKEVQAIKERIKTIDNDTMYTNVYNYVSVNARKIQSGGHGDMTFNGSIREDLRNWRDASVTVTSTSDGLIISIDGNRSHPQKTLNEHLTQRDTFLVKINDRVLTVKLSPDNYRRLVSLFSRSM